MYIYFPYSSHTVPSATEVRNSERVRTERVRRERETDACLKEICLPSLGKHLQVMVWRRPEAKHEQETGRHATAGYLFELPAFIQGRITYIDVEIPKSYSSVHNFLSEKWRHGGTDRSLVTGWVATDTSSFSSSPSSPHPRAAPSGGRQSAVLPLLPPLLPMGL